MEWILTMKAANIFVRTFTRMTLNPSYSHWYSACAFPQSNCGPPHQTSQTKPDLSWTIRFDSSRHPTRAA
jgi:hypothetical protein